MTGGPFVIGGGFDATAARTALSAYVALGKDTLAARTKARAAMQGWTLIQLDEPASRWTAAIKDLVQADKIPLKKQKGAKSSEPEKEKSVVVVTPSRRRWGSLRARFTSRGDRRPSRRPEESDGRIVRADPPDRAHDAFLRRPRRRVDLDRHR